MIVKCRLNPWTASFAMAVAILVPAMGDPGKLSVSVDQPGIKISPKIWGLMTEEINHSYDGGIYGELIQNRAFKDNPRSPVFWSSVAHGDAAGNIELDSTNPATSALNVSLKVTASAASSTGKFGVANAGFWGIPVTPNTKYRASFFVRNSVGSIGGLTAALESSDGSKVFATAETGKIGPTWKQVSVTLTTGSVEPSTDNRFVIYLSSPGTIFLSQVSLFPPTFNNRPNGNRVDLMKKLGAMKPAFLRLPGGNYLEGDTFEERFAWKETIHDPSQRAGHRCPWGYRSSDGLGILEFFEWCEDLKMEPILAVFAGYVLRGQHVDAGPALQPYVDEALEEIEYATGDKSTKWGAVRAKDGHPAPFKIEYVEIGNEDWFDRSGSYEARFAQFYDAIKKRYPELKLIATGPVKSRTPDVIDDHYYRSAVDMERDVHHYDNYSRSGPKIFVGEWASTEGSPTPTLKAALGDAAWMTGMERNSDLIPISCYAPLLVNVNRGARQWGTNLIGYDALHSFGSPSYYVQAMFGNNRGDLVLPSQVTPQSTPAPAAPRLPTGAIGVGSWLTNAEYKDISVTDKSGKVIYRTDLTSASGWKLGAGTWKASAGTLTQSSDETDCRAVAGDTKWSDYTYSLKAKKISGAEGFLVMFHVKDNDNFLWWNIGGWGNSRSVIEKSSGGAKREIGRPSGVTVETGRWYDIRIEVSGNDIRCFLDGKLITETKDVVGERVVDPVYTACSKDLSTGEVILKVVNVSDGHQELAVDLSGAKSVASSGSIEVIAGDPSAVNTVEEPEKVAPKRSRIGGLGKKFTHSFPAHSFTIIRVKAS